MIKLTGTAQVGVTWEEPEIGVCKVKYKLKPVFDVEIIRNGETEPEPVSIQRPSTPKNVAAVCSGET